LPRFLAPPSAQQAHASCRLALALNSAIPTPCNCQQEASARSFTSLLPHPVQNSANHDFFGRLHWRRTDSFPLATNASPLRVVGTRALTKRCPAQTPRAPYHLHPASFLHAEIGARPWRPHPTACSSPNRKPSQEYPKSRPDELLASDRGGPGVSRRRRPFVHAELRRTRFRQRVSLINHGAVSNISPGRSIAPMLSRSGRAVPELGPTVCPAWRPRITSRVPSERLIAKLGERRSCHCQLKF